MLVCAEQELTTPLSKLSFLASKMGVSRAEADSKHAADSSVGGDLVRRRISGKSFDVTMSDRSAQVLHDADLKERTEKTALQLLPLSVASANVNTWYPKHELPSYGRLGSELMYSKVQPLELAFDECECHVVDVQESRAKSWCAQRRQIPHVAFCC